MTKLTPKALTPRMQAFVAEYLKDFNGTQAAIRAGYSPDAAKQQASRLLTYANVQKAVQAALDSARSSAIMSYEEMCERLSRMGRVAITDYVAADGRIELGRGDANAVQAVDQVQDREGNPIVKVRLVDRLKAMEQLARLQGYNAPMKVAPTDPSGERPFGAIGDAELLAIAAAKAASVDGSDKQDGDAK